MKLIELNIDKIIALCKKYKVAKLWVFGSILTPRFNDQSDVDFSVEFDRKAIDDMFVVFFDFVEELQTLLNRKIDLVDETAIKNPYFRKQLDATKQLIYG
ncbi:MAG: nucleotidyltransferase domain-containing protein [Paramuribaculum sp.]|nr:nucleotidyltransferase domain-containing protein [Paramuribaculum sp.]MDE6303506.1 nucleotidyltransferase domain-containing protein [Paramuribaculum sp.]